MRRSSAEDAVESVEQRVDPLDHALALAHRYLNRRDRTVREMRLHLHGKVSDPAAADEALAILQDQGLLDDVRFARLYAEDKRTLEQWGSERIRSSLLGRGIEPELVEEALDDGLAEPDLERALEVLRRRFPEPPRERRDRERAFGVLVRKGYDVEVAVEALTVHSRGDRSFRAS